ncbi:hypothetical protein EVAR_36354_1 [Eumeta japonica]|uniref:Uncharacterized protein n=1 Tax=Eumeta variegata TaxID=151549 RepID=A0A4C1W8A5_EUMVA|nr:hypothetical protein EVAR_36354_1 [Eumeta japonica]
MRDLPNHGATVAPCSSLSRYKLRKMILYELQSLAREVVRSNFPLTHGTPPPSPRKAVSRDLPRAPYRTRSTLSLDAEVAIMKASTNHFALFSASCAKCANLLDIMNDGRSTPTAAQAAEADVDEIL